MAHAPAAAHAIALLKLLARHAGPVPAAALARELGLPRSTTYRLLAVLCEEGFVMHLVEERRYGLGVEAFALGAAYSRQAPLQRAAQPLLTRLVELTSQNAHLAVLHGREVLYVIEERAPGRPPLVTDVGVRLPAALTASGLAMLAVLPPAQVRALFPDRHAFVRRHDVGAAGPDQLRTQLVEVRRRGYAVEDGLVTPGFWSVAAAVRDYSGHPLAAVAITCPVATMPPQRRPHLASQVCATALHLTRRMGGSPAQDGG